MIIICKQLQLQVIILNTNKLQSYGLKYSYLIQIIYTQSYGFKQSIMTILCKQF